MFELTKRSPEISFPELMRRFWDVEPSFRTWATVFQPVVDILETDKEFKLVAECPGIKKEEIEVTLEGTTLTLTGEKKELTENKDEKEGVYHSERRYGRFSRSFTLPERVDAKKIAAAYKDGILEVLLPKVPEAQPHKIQIAAK
jgi:HSP20 family protein